ncbi:MAG: hypothetical protein ACQCN5_12845 [Candidatus Bathyarchaeia archaeon]|jgi:membrane associated rhomboid family serine protease
MASSQNFIGVFSSVIVHRDIGHLTANMFLAFATLLLYSFSTTFSGNRQYLSMTIIIWISAIIANLGYILLFPFYSVGGSSGLVSAFLGAVVMVAFLSALKETVASAKFVQSIIGIIVFCIFIAINIGVSADTNVIVHLTSFLLAAIVVLLANLREGHKVYSLQ